MYLIVVTNLRRIVSYSFVVKSVVTTVTILSLTLFTNCSRTEKRKPTPLEEFNKNIRTTEARTPAEEQDGFELPDGFEIQLFAAEPDIGKPLNMAFDARGRMWLTQSNEYPFPNDAGKDKIIILEDTDKDGQADKFTTFADSLNIPIGITPVKDGAIAYSIPYVFHLIDHDGDSHADERKVLLSGFEFKDTHGMINNFVRGLDGWIHADHGYKNSSKVVGTSKKDTVFMTSGNTFRFLPDGSNVELTTTGRVNPFGLTYDEFGYMYGVDCHSSPIYQLIRGGDYPHFGKKPTGIGYAPFMMRHEYGSTALAGLEYYAAPHFPTDYQSSFYYGDVVMSRVLRTSMKMVGTTPVPKQEKDFIISDDPWFRPVDIKLGPDGALYVADFYNRIIGHYEVPLDHPGRDRQRGRIWRITYKGKDAKLDYQSKDWSNSSLEQLLAGLSDPNPTVRMLIADLIADSFGETASEALINLIKSMESTPEQRRHGLWILYRLKALPDDVLAAATKNADITVRVHALQIMFEYDSLSSPLLQIAKQSLIDSNPHVQRAASMIIAKYPESGQLKQLIQSVKSASADDSHLVYSIRQALRDHLRDPQVMEGVSDEKWDEQDARVLADVLVGVDSERAAIFLLAHLEAYTEPEQKFIEYTRHIARYLPLQNMNKLVNLSLRNSEHNLDLQYTLFESFSDGLAQRGAQMNSGGKSWGVSLAAQFLNYPTPDWNALPFENLPYNENPWRLMEISVTEGGPSIRVLATNPDGTHTGTISSPEFIIPNELNFYLVGHKKAPLEGEVSSPVSNKVQLRLSESHEVIAEDDVPDEITRKQVGWKLNAQQGKKGYLVIIDGSATRREYIGIGNITPSLIAFPDLNPDQISKRQIFASSIAQKFKVQQFKQPLIKLAESKNVDINVRANALSALLAIQPDAGIEYAGKILKDNSEHPLLQQQILKAVGSLSLPASNRLLADMLSSVPYAAKKDIALSLAKTTGGVDLLFEAANRMSVSPQLLLDKKVSESLESVMLPAQRTTLAQLTKDIKPPDEEIQALIDQRLATFDPTSSSVEQGIRIFNQSCLVCHEVKKQGGNIGPQLDGIGNWGARALTEKIFDPNRNISQAFINYTIKLKDGNVQSGLFRREEGNVVVFANVTGQEFSIPKNSIEEQKPTPFTLMPDQFSETLSEQDFNALLTYLLSLK
jgi:putative heme-binding domain-containing protein